jgi:Zn-finger nucleic acid-binding protein
MLMRHPDLIDVLEKSWHAISCETAEMTEFRPTEGWQKEPKYLCPDCRQTMEKYGYMGIAAIQIDRCDPCALVWLDANELQNMVLALAKTNYRSEAAWQKAKRQDWDLITPVDLSDPRVRVTSAGRWWLYDAGGYQLGPAFQLLGLLFR